MQTSGSGDDPRAAAAELFSPDKAPERWLVLDRGHPLGLCADFYDADGQRLTGLTHINLRDGVAVQTGQLGENRQVTVARMQLRQETPIHLWRQLIFTLAAEAGLGVMIS